MNKLILIIMLLCVAVSAEAKPIVADLSSHEINIDTEFTGTDILLYGARNDIGDIAVVVRGPKKHYVVRKKERVAGVWVNSAQEEFRAIDSFYAIASSKPLNELQNQPFMKSLGIGSANPDLMLLNKKENRFYQALEKRMQDIGLYAKEQAEVRFWGDTLFRTVLEFPENLPRGWYSAEVYLFNDGQLSSVQITPVHVSKIGFEAFVFDFAHEYPFLYGLAAAVIALVTGWLASIVFYRV